jgi:hypothetical protein
LTHFLFVLIPIFVVHLAQSPIIIQLLGYQRACCPTTIYFDDYNLQIINLEINIYWCCIPILSSLFIGVKINTLCQFQSFHVHRKLIHLGKRTFNINVSTSCFVGDSPR